MTRPPRRWRRVVATLCAIAAVGTAYLAASRATDDGRAPRGGEQHVAGHSPHRAAAHVPAATVSTLAVPTSTTEPPSPKPVAAFVPAEFPADLALPGEVELLSAGAGTDAAGAPQANAVYRTRQPVDAVVAEWEGKLASAGWGDIAKEATPGVSAQLRASKPGREAEVLVAQGDAGSTYVTVVSRPAGA